MRRPSVHPLEQLRYVARGWESLDEVPVPEIAQVLAELAEESPASLVHACRRLIEYLPSSGRLWWLSARALSAAEPVEGIWEAAEELVEDPTAKRLAEALPAGAGVSVLAPAGAGLGALRRRLHERGGWETAGRDGAGQRRSGPEEARRRGGGRQRTVPETAGQRGGGGRRTGGEVRGPDIVVVAALAAGPDALLVNARAARRAPDLARQGGAVWAVVPRGTVLPPALWEQLLVRAEGGGDVEVLSPESFSTLAGPDGPATAADLLSSPKCPAVAELLGWRS